MEVIYAREALPERVIRTVFLAGPTPRSQDTASWRPDALDALRRFGFAGRRHDQGGGAALGVDEMDVESAGRLGRPGRQRQQQGSNEGSASHG